MRYRILDPKDWDRLKPLLSEYDQAESIPHPDASTVAIAEDENGNIVGCLFLQLAFHMEPLVLKSPNVRFDELYSTIYNAISDHKGLHFYAFSDKEIVDRMARYVGMQETSMKVFMGKVE